MTCRYQIVGEMNVMGEDGKEWAYAYHGVFDGHGGSSASDYVRDNLHKNIFASSSFPDDIDAAILEGFSTVCFFFIFFIIIY